MTDTSLADDLSALARDLEQRRDLQGTLDAVVNASVGTVPGAEHASITSIRKRQLVETTAATNGVARQIDAAQYSTGQGPCLDSLFDGDTVRLPDLATEERWPEFIARARELGVGSMLCLRLYVREDDLGALNLSSSQPNAFSEESEHTALLFASHAAVAMVGARDTANQAAALATRDLIGQAKGILMERFKITGEEAFHLLVLVSQRSNRKLHVVADELASTGLIGDAAL